MGHRELRLSLIKAYFFFVTCSNILNCYNFTLIPLKILTKVEFVKSSQTFYVSNKKQFAKFDMKTQILGVPSFLMSCFLIAEKMAQLVLTQLVKVSSTGQVGAYSFHRVDNILYLALILCSRQ